MSSSLYTPAANERPWSKAGCAVLSATQSRLLSFRISGRRKRPMSAMAPRGERDKWLTAVLTGFTRKFSKIRC